VAVAESAPQADTRSVCVIVGRVNISTDTEHQAAGLSAIAELLVFCTGPGYGLGIVFVGKCLGPYK